MRLMTAAQVAVMLEVDESWVYRHKDEIGYYRLGKKLVRFTEQMVDGYIERRSVQAGPELGGATLRPAIG